MAIGRRPGFTEAGAVRPASWLTLKRVRIHGLLLAVSLWTVYVVDMSAPGLLDRNGLVKGTDFLHFYTLGRLALQNRGDLLYNMRAQANLAREFVTNAPDSFYVPLYGPQVSLFFAPFAQLPYGYALVAWLAVNVLIYACCCFAVWKTCPGLQTYRWTVLILAIGFPGFFHLLAWGQTSGLALLCFTLAYLALRRHHTLLAGLAIGSLIFKPQLGLAAAVVFVCAREWKVVAGSVMAATVQLAAAWLDYGTVVMRAYLHALTHVRDVLPLLEPRLYQTHSLRSFWSLLLPWPRVAFGLYVVSTVVSLALAVRVWTRRSSLSIRFSALLLATVLVSPHLTVYDLIILAPAFLLLGDWAAVQCEQAPRIQQLLYLCYPLFLIGPLTRITHLQLSVMAMAALLWITWQASSRRVPSVPNPAVSS
jgi:alpha-1,2-mannosyltransferase